MHYWIFEYAIIRGPCLEKTITEMIFDFSGSFHTRPEAKWRINPLDLKHWVFICVYNVTFIGPKVCGACFVAPSCPPLTLTLINVFLKQQMLWMNLSHNHTNIVSRGMGTYSKITRLHELAVATPPQRGWPVDVSRMHQADTTTADLMKRAHVHFCGFVVAAE